MPVEIKRQPKDLALAEIRLRTRCCRREHKFEEGNPMRACHFGLEEIDQQRCAYCVWYGDVNAVPGIKTLTGRDLIKLQQFFAGLREEPEV